MALRFRASAAGDLMTNKQGAKITKKQLDRLDYLIEKLAKTGKLTDIQSDELNKLSAKKNKPFELSDTAKGFVEKMWRKNEKDVEEFLTNKYIEKGLSEEQMGVNLLSRIDGNLYKKNEEYFDNGVFSGTPDINSKHTEYIDDIKSSWDLKTYMGAEMTDLYYWQLQVYMELTGKRKARLRYCLVDTPQKLIDDEKRRVLWKLGGLEQSLDEESDEIRPIMQQIETNMTFSHYPDEERVKTFEVEYDEEGIKELYFRCEEALKYYKTIKLGGHEFYKK